MMEKQTRSNQKIVLASTSKIRQEILTNAGVKFTVKTGNVDEGVIKQELLAKSYSIEQIAIALASAKAHAVKCGSDQIIIGADQIMEMDGKLYDKPKSIREAKDRLKEMRGRTHRLIGAVCLVEKGKQDWHYQGQTELMVRDFSDEFLDDYLNKEGVAVLKSVGAYMFEKRGAQLFEWVEGDFFSILGLPLLPILQVLRQRGVVKI